MSVGKIISVILKGLPNTLSLLVLSFILAVVLGIFLTWVHLRHHRLWRGIAEAFVNIVRGTPPLLMLLLSYYGLPVLLKLVGINIDHWTRLTFGVLGLGIGWSAYLEEAFRSAYLSVDPGQIEAARSVGMDDVSTMRQIILPQAGMLALPNIENLVIGLVKATSLVYVLGLYDMYNQASNLAQQNEGEFQLEIFCVLALMYWAIVLILEAIFRWIRKRFAAIIE